MKLDYAEVEREIAQETAAVEGGACDDAFGADLDAP